MGVGTMSTEFAPPIYLFGDRAGQGRWEIGHYRQHLRYQTLLAQQTTPFIIPDHPLILMGKTDLERKIWLNDHQNVHNILRARANVSGVDLSQVNFNDPHDFLTWLDAHAVEHSLIDLAFGL